MSDVLYKAVTRFASWPVIALLFIAYALATQGFDARRAALGYETRLLDVRFAYSPDDARALFEQLGAPGRTLYALTEVSLDLVFPFIYNGLLAVLIFHVWERAAAKHLLWLPVLTTAADLLENATVTALALTFNGSVTPIAWAASAFTSTKLLLGVLSVMVVLVGAARGIRGAFNASEAI